MYDLTQAQLATTLPNEKTEFEGILVNSACQGQKAAILEAISVYEKIEFEGILVNSSCQGSGGNDTRGDQYIYIYIYKRFTSLSLSHGFLGILSLSATIKPGDDENPNSNASYSLI